MTIALLVSFDSCHVHFIVNIIVAEGCSLPLCTQCTVCGSSIIDVRTVSGSSIIDVQCLVLVSSMYSVWF